MYLDYKTEKRLFIRPTKFGKSSQYYRQRVIYQFICDACQCSFERDKGKISEKRLNNKHKHFCSTCNPQAEAWKLGQISRLKNLEKKIGERTIDECGYVRIYVGRTHPYTAGYGGAIREHIVVMENYLKRSLKKGEVIHHIDGDKTNNNIMNLDLCTVTEHNKCHARSEAIIFELYKQGIVGYDRTTKQYFLCDKIKV